MPQRAYFPLRESSKRGSSAIRTEWPVRGHLTNGRPLSGEPRPITHIESVRVILEGRSAIWIPLS